VGELVPHQLDLILVDTVNGWSTGRETNFCEKRNEKNENYTLGVEFI
jgi:hypothetical protein